MLAETDIKNDHKTLIPNIINIRTQIKPKYK